MQNILAERNGSYSNSAVLQLDAEYSLWLLNTDHPFIIIIIFIFVVFLKGIGNFDFLLSTVAAIEEICDAT